MEDKVRDFIGIIKAMGWYECSLRGVPPHVYSYRRYFMNNSFVVDGVETTAVFFIDEPLGSLLFRWFPKEGKEITKVFRSSITDDDFHATKESVEKLIHKIVDSMKEVGADYLGKEPSRKTIRRWHEDISIFERKE